MSMNSTTFFQRTKVISKHLSKRNADCLLIIIGDCTNSYSKSYSIYRWLFGFCPAHSAFLLSKNNLIILTTKSATKFLKPIIEAKEEMKIKVIEVDKFDNYKKSVMSFQSSIDNLIDLKSIGQLSEDKFEGKFFEMVKSAVESIKKDFIDVSDTFAALAAVKDDTEVKKIKKAGKATAATFNKYLKTFILDAVDLGQEIEYNELSSMTEKYVKRAAKGDMKGLDFCVPTTVRSGRVYKPKFDSDYRTMKMGVLVCSMGLKFEDYCSKIIRTLMVDPNPEQRGLYDYVTDELYVYGLKQLQPKIRCADVANAILDKLRLDKPSLSERLVTSFVFGTGSEFEDRYEKKGASDAGSGSETVLAENMVIEFSVKVDSGWTVLDEGDGDGREMAYSVCVGDTVVVGGGTRGSGDPEMVVGGNAIVTGGLRYNTYRLEEEEPARFDPRFYTARAIDASSCRLVRVRADGMEETLVLDSVLRKYGEAFIAYTSVFTEIDATFMTGNSPPLFMSVGWALQRAKRDLITIAGGSMRSLFLWPAFVQVHKQRRFLKENRETPKGQAVVIVAATDVAASEAHNDVLGFEYTQSALCDSSLLSTALQQQLLDRPEIVVGTPGGIWRARQLLCLDWVRLVVVVGAENMKTPGLRDLVDELLFAPRRRPRLLMTAAAAPRWVQRWALREMRNPVLLTEALEHLVAQEPVPPDP